MKYIQLLMMILLICSSAECSLVQNETVGFISTYKDIPGVTEKEIIAIEVLKANRDKFLYGAVLSTETFILPDGSDAGFSKKFCMLLSKLFGINFELEICEWDELRSRIENRSIDFTGDLTPTAERMKIYSMTSPIAERLLRIFMRTDSNIRSEDDVKGRRIGFFESSVTMDFVMKKYPVLFTPVGVSNYHTAAEMIRNGEIDAFIGESVADIAFSDYGFIRSAIFWPTLYLPASMATANPELNPIISVVNKYVAAGGFDRLYKLYTEGDFDYSKYKLHKSFTDEEKAYIEDLKQRGKSVAVAFESDNYPVSFYNKKEGQFQGIAVDIINRISRFSDIKFEAVGAKDATWAEIYKKIMSKEVQMVSQLLHSESRKDKFIWSAVPYARSYYVIMSRLNYPNLVSYQVMRSTVGVLEKSAHEDIYKELFPDNDNIKEYGTWEECLDALEREEIDLLMASEYTLITQIHYREKLGYKINIRLNAPMDSYFGFHKDEKVLASIINKAQQYVKTGEIETSWTSRVFDYSKKLAEERTFYLSVFISVLLLVLIFTIFLLGKNMVISKELREIAHKDALTGIFNRRYFMEHSLAQLERSLRTKRECFIIIFDLDHFKAINDKYGHLAGDTVLKEIVQKAKNNIRSYDLFGRFGGEEFIIFMPDIDKPNVINTVERIRQEVCKAPVKFEGKGIQISASFGIAPAAPINDMNTAIDHADKALYQAKEIGRNRVVFYEENEQLKMDS